jgi:hypothetical protein
MGQDITVEDIAALTTLTLSKFGKYKVTDIAADITDYVMVSKLLPNHKEVMGSGKDFTFNVATGYGDNARHVGMYSVDNVDVKDAVTQGTVPYRHTEWSYAFDKHEEAFNSGPERIVDHILLRREEEKGGFAELMEETWWSKPTSSADTLTPFGIDYWVVTNASTGFNGGNPSGFTDGAGGISSTTYPKWSNYTGNYTNVTKGDLVRKMKTAKRKIKFKSPMDGIQSYDKDKVNDRYALYTQEDVIADFEAVGEAQNENLGKDVDSMFGQVVVNGNPLIYIPYLDDNDAVQKKIYMINWGVMDILCLKGWYMKETVRTSGTQHNVVNVFNDITWNSCCKDRRKQAVFSLS